MSDRTLSSELVEAVKALGGSKQVAPKIWPEKSPDAAQRLLLDCLNDDRPAHLTPEQAMLVLQMAHARGYHGAFAYMAETLGYAPPVPIEPRDEVAELQRQFVAASQAMAAMVTRMERLQNNSAPIVPRSTLRAA